MTTTIGVREMQGRVCQCGNVVWCKGLCRNCYQRKWVAKNRSKVRSQKLASARRRRFGGLHEMVMNRAKHRCEQCGSTSQLTIHHKDKSGKREHDQNNKLANLEVLCRKCHAKAHREEHRRGLGLNDKPKLKAFGKWSRKHDACVQCGKISSYHEGHGLCRACYQRNRMK